FPPSAAVTSFLLEWLWLFSPPQPRLFMARKLIMMTTSPFGSVVTTRDDSTLLQLHCFFCVFYAILVANRSYQCHIVVILLLIMTHVSLALYLRLSDALATTFFPYALALSSSQMIWPQPSC
ncbi:hypothetical protein L195_g019917, partial [Trifolium pratense]